MRYLSCAETAKLIRVKLKEHFPGVKFSVRSDVYSGGASIDIHWVLGPTSKEVDQVVGGFKGASFDGMNDLRSSQTSWLLPNGTAALAERPDSWGGSIPGYVSDAPHPNAELVRFGAHYIFTNREYAPTWEGEKTVREVVAKAMCQLQGIEYKHENQTGLYGSGDYNRSVTEHARLLLQETTFKPGETYAGVRYATQTEREVDYTTEPMRIIKATT